jgi:hypothetical protein
MWGMSRGSKRGAAKAKEPYGSFNSKTLRRFDLPREDDEPFGASHAAFE